jgi:hypothetical protein
MRVQDRQCGASRGIVRLAVILTMLFGVGLAQLALRLAPAARAASCNGASHAVSLTAPGASPRTGTTSTTITLSVEYHDTAACPPNLAVAVVPGVGRIPLSVAGGSAGTTIRFQGRTRLPAGTWTYGFEATGGTGAGEQLVTIAGPAKIVNSAPAPVPAATPTPTPAPTARPAPTPARTPTPTPAATKPPTASPVPTSQSSSPPSRAPGDQPSGPAAASATPSEAVTAPLNWVDDDPIGPPWSGGSGVTPPVAVFTTRLEIDHETRQAVATWLVMTTIGVLLFVAVVRRSLPIGLVPAELSALVLDDRRGSGRGGHRTAGGEPLPGAPIAPVLARPRLERGGWTGGRGLPSREPLTFAEPAATGTTRRTIAYRHVRISAGPDDLRSAEVGRLDRDDEVEILGETDGFIQVRTPAGVVGWVPRVVFLGGSAGG